MRLSCDQAVDRAKPVFGSIQDRPQLAFLYELAALAPDGIAVEVGVLYGRSLIAWAAARQGRGPIVAVDHWIYGLDQRQTFLNNMQQAGLVVRLLECESWEAPALIGEPVAFAFIDSDHSYEAAQRDIAAWAPAILPAGILALHDYGTWKGNVKGAVDEWQAIDRWEQIGELVSSTIAFTKPGGECDLYRRANR